MVSFVIDIGDPAVLQIGSIIWIVRDSRRTREELVSIGHIAEDNAMEALNAADSFIRNHAGVSDHVPCHLRWARFGILILASFSMKAARTFRPLRTAKEKFIAAA